MNSTKQRLKQDSEAILSPLVMLSRGVPRRRRLWESTARWI